MKRTHSIENFKLTEREKDVAKYVACGTPRKSIADNLKISVYTVAVHLEAIRRKLNVSTTFEAGCILSHYFK